MSLQSRLNRLERRGGAPQDTFRFHIGVIEAGSREEWEREYARRVREAGESELVFTFRIGAAPGEESEEAD
jgi:hypothetical protein